MRFETLDWSVGDEGILTLTLDRPDQLNAFSLTMAAELEQAFIRVRSDDSVRAVIVTGRGRAFCAGMDLTVSGNVFGLDESAAPTAEDLRNHLTDPPYQDGVRDTGGKVTLAIHACDKPVIAAVNGAAVGIGATMTLAMDVRLAATTARMGFVFGRLGIVPEAASSFFLPRLVGLQTALEWVYSADLIPADEAHAKGLVRSVHEPDELLPAARRAGGEIRPWAVASRSRDGSAALVRGRRLRPSAGGAPARQPRDVARLGRGRQGRRRGLPGETAAGVHVRP